MTPDKRRHLRQIALGRPSLEYIQSVLTIVDGALVWRERRGQAGLNARVAGKPVALRTCPKGYLFFKVRRFRFAAHRVIWALHYGRWPNGQIDHINGDPADNRIENLRDVSNAENCRNKRLQANNSSGVTGVHWAKHRNRWIAQIGSHATHEHLGVFAKFEDATAARKTAERRRGYSERHGTARQGVAQ